MCFWLRRAAQELTLSLSSSVQPLFFSFNIFLVCRVFLGIIGCFCLFLFVYGFLGCFLVFLGVFGYFWLYFVVFGCLGVFLSVLGCFFCSFLL